MHFLCFAIAALIAANSLASDQGLPKPFLTGLNNPESAVIGVDGRLYVSEVGEHNKDGDGGVVVIEDGKAVPFAEGMNDPKGLVAVADAFYVTDVTRVHRIDAKGQHEEFLSAEAFPSPPKYLNDIEVDRATGVLYVSDSGADGKGGAVYAVDPKTKKVETILDAKTYAAASAPNGLLMDGGSHLLELDFGSGELVRINLADRSVEKIADGFEGGDGLAWDKFGRLFITSWQTGKVWGIPRPGEEPVLMFEGLQSAADLCLTADGKELIVPDMKAGTLTRLPRDIAGWEVDESPLPLATAPAFSKLDIAGWQPFDENGKPDTLRPILLMPAGDGTNRLFLARQYGQIHVFEHDAKKPDAAGVKTSIFADISDRVRYSDQQNEEGLLGMAFHPKFKENGEFFLFYTDKKAKLQNVVSRFRVSKDNPSKMDPEFEEEILRISKPFWNHDGGTIAFGPDGYLYITHGDGGAGNDPFGNGQKLSTHLGKVLRIDIDRQDDGKNYAVPKDNPFVGREGVTPEIWAYGLRNIWRMAFDPATGKLWAGEVGQNIYEEIILIEKGGNYGWNLREALHPFGAAGVGPRKDLIEPIWEYHHDIGRSITGGLVYRGKQFPELEGAYLYADYVSGRIWALWYDEAKQRVIANRPIKDRGLPVMSFGEDAQGEVYLLTFAPDMGIYRLVREGE